MWMLIFIGGLYVLIQSARLLFVRSSVPTWLTVLIALAAIIAMVYAPFLIWITTPPFERWLDRLTNQTRQKADGSS